MFEIEEKSNADTFFGTTRIYKFHNISVGFKTHPFQNQTKPAYSKYGNVFVVVTLRLIAINRLMKKKKLVSQNFGDCNVLAQRRCYSYVLFLS